MVFLPLSVPFPVPEIGSAIEIETNQEYWGVDFAITDSNYRFADYVDETVKVFFLTRSPRLSTCIHTRRGNQFSVMVDFRDGPYPFIRVGVKFGVRHVKAP